MAQGLTTPWLIKTSALGGVAVGMTGCAGPQVADYSQQKPVLDLRTYFNGVVDAWGIFTDRSGAVVKRFKVQMNCQWQGDEGVLDEDFVYSDGTKQKRIWRLKACPMVDMKAAQTMWWASRRAKSEAMHFVGNTPWPCPSTAVFGMLSLMIGCS
jgi:hypothetical protein